MYTRTPHTRTPAHAGIASADVPGMRASFTLDIDAALCNGSGPQRLAQPFTSYFADDVSQHCQVHSTPTLAQDGARTHGPRRKSMMFPVLRYRGAVLSGFESKSCSVLGLSHTT